MNYRVFNKDKMLKLNNNQAFVFGCFSFKSDYETGDSSVNQETLAKFCRCSVSKIQDYISIFKEQKIIVKSKQVCKVSTDNKIIRKNHYRLDVPDKHRTNYFRVNKEYFEQDIPANILGYVLLLKCLCINCTNDCFYNLTEIASHLKVGYSTLKGKNGLHQKAINYGLIEDEEVDYDGKKVIRHRIVNPHIPKEENTNLPNLASRLGQLEDHFLVAYNHIRKLCTEIGVKPPPYHTKMMSKLIGYVPVNTLYDYFKKRIKVVKDEKITSLQYFLKVAGTSYVENPEPEHPSIIL